MNAAVATETATRPYPHPNDFDLRRIERALKARKRYRYVSPNVATVAGGYRIESPCCSRNIDRDGGVIDVALLIFDADRAAWRLFRKNHDRQAWEFHSTHARLIELLQELNADPEREFWQ
jgi:Protein of unknown function (DUF3024)